MKRILLLFFMFVLAMTAVAQRTQKITYQAVVRDGANRLVVYTPVRVDVTITSSTGSYFESLRDTTNANGLMYVLIGGNPGFEDIDWVEAVIKTVITIDGGESVSDEVAVTAVPFALQASYATNVSPTAPTIVAVYNQIQADSLALANQIAAERAHLDDTLSHYLMKEVQVLSISNDTIYLTGGSFVKLPAGFSGDYNDLVNKPTNVSAFNNDAGYITNTDIPTNVSAFTNDAGYLTQEVQVLSVSNDTLYLTGGSWVKLPQGFSGDYNDLTNLPDLNQYATNVHLNDTLKSYLTINGLCDSIKNCDVITNLQTADSLLGIRITGDSMVLAGKIYSDSVYLKGLIDSIKVNVTNNTTNITNNTTNISNITNYVTSLQVADSVLNDRFTRDSIALSNRLDTMFTHICDSVKPCVTDLINDTLKAYTTTNKIDTLLGAYATNAHLNDTLGNYITNTHLNDTLGHYLMQEVQVLSIGNDTIYLTGGSFVKLPAGFSGDYNELSNKPDLNQYATNAHLNDTLSHYLMQEVQVLSVSNDTLYLTGGSWVKLPQGFSGNYNDLTNLPDLNQYATNVHLNDTLKNYLTTNGLCDSIKNCEVINNLQIADSLLSVRITRDSILFYKADSVLSVHMINDSILFHKTDSVLLVHILNDSVLSHQADSILLALILRDSTNLANNYYNQIKINDTIAYILSQIAGATGNLNDNYYTKLEINDTLSHYTTSDRIDSLLGDYVKRDTLENYLTIAGLCDSIKNCEVITNLQAADSLLGIRITRDSILSYKADSILADRITRDSILSYKADSILANRITRDSILSYKADSILANRITRDSILFYKADSVLSARITADSINLVNNYYNKIKINDTVAYILSQIAGATGNLNDNYYTKLEINDTLSHYTTSDRIDSLLGDYVKKDTLKNYLTIAGLCDSIKNCDVIANMATGITTNTTNITNNTTNITNLQIADSVLNARFTKDSTILANRMDTLLKHVCDSVKPCVTEWMNDTLKAYTTTNKIDTLIQKYGYLTSDSAVIVMMRDSIQKVNAHVVTDSIAIMDTLHKYYATNDTLKNYYTIYQVDTAKAHIRNEIQNGALTITYGTTTTTFTANQPTGSDVSVTIPTPAEQVQANWNETDASSKAYIQNKPDLTVYATKDALKDSTRMVYDTLHRYYATKDTLKNFLTISGLCDSVMSCDGIERMRDSIQKVNAHVVADSLAIMDTLHRYYVTNAHLNDTLGHYTTTDQIDTLLNKHHYLTSDSTVIVMMRDSIQKVNAHVVADSLAIMDTLHRYYATKDTLKNFLTISGLCDSVMSCDGIERMRDSIQKVNAHVVADSLAIMDTLHRFYVTNAHLNDTLGHYTTTDQIDTLLNKHHYLTSDSTVIVMMRDSIQKVNAHVVADSLAIMDTLHRYYATKDTLKNFEKKSDLCKDVMVCIGDTLSNYTTTNQIDTLIRKYGYLTSDSAVVVMMRDSIQKVNKHVSEDSLILAQRIYKDSVVVMDTLHKYYATKDTLKNFVKKDALCDEVMACTDIKTMRDSIQKVNAHIVADSLVLAQRIYRDSLAMMDTLHRHYATKDTLKNFLTISGLCDSVMACDDIKMMRDSIQKVNTRLTNDSTALASRMNIIGDSVRKNLDTIRLNRQAIIDTASNIRRDMANYEKKTDLCKDVMACEGIQNMRDSIYKVNTRLTNDSTALASRMNIIGDSVRKNLDTIRLNRQTIIDTASNIRRDMANYEKKDDLCKDVMACTDIKTMRDSIQKVNTRLTNDSTALAHRMDTLLKHVCDSVQECVTGWIKDSTRMVFDTLYTHYTSLKTLKDSTTAIRGALVDTARNIRNSIGNGTLSIQYGTNPAVKFGANQDTNTTVNIPLPPEPTYGTLIIKKNDEPVGTFIANETKEINITVPTCDSLAECDLIKSILARLDKLERQNDSLAKEIEKFKPTLTVAASDESVTVCSGSILPVTYTATFHNCSSSDYTLAWKVNGTDSSNVTGTTLVFNAETAGEYKVVCVATRPGYVTVTDTVTTIVAVDEAIPSFTASVTNLTVELTGITNTATIQWDTDSATVPFSGNSATHTYAVADTITITATNEGGCTFIKGLRLQATAPVVTTDSVPASTIAATTAKAYGTVTSDGGIPETKRGVVYSTTNSNLELGADGVDSVMSGTGMGSFTCNLTRLVPCTQYYVRAFAYNEVDTVYGVVKDFTTPSFTCGSTLYDIDGNNYGTLLLGSQCWMKQNLRTTRFADGTEIPKGSISLSSATLPYYYEPDSNIATYGRLYNWTAAMHGSPSSLTNPSDVQGVCPDGWHLPSDTEWTQLTSFVASNSENVCGNNPAYIAKALASNEGWEYFDTSSVSVECYLVTDVATNNKTLFSVLPAGTWEVGKKAGYTNHGHSIFRTATEYEQVQHQAAYARQFYGDQAFVERTAPIKEVGYSVRCVLDCATDTFPPTVSAVKITNTGDSTVSMAAIVLSNGGAEVTARGVCWSTSQHPTTSNFIASSGAGNGDFSVTGKLKLGTTYYVRAYATNSKGTAYGAEVIFNMPNVPTVTTAAAASVVNATDATIGGNVTADGGMPVTARGMCWSTSPEPTIGNGNDTTMNGTGLGSFEASLKNLTSSTTYHVRAYATNDVGTAYGEDVSFTTASLIPPTVTTGAVNLNVTIANVITATATCEGNVTDEGTDAVTARGVCWSISQNPTVNDSLTTDDGSGTGSFTCNITGFNASTTYYVRAYATNSAGTAYGNQVVFTPKVDAKSCVAAPTVTDHEGNVYATVKIGNQCWMRENLRTTTSPKTGTYLVNTKNTRKPYENPSQYQGSKVAHWYGDNPTYASKGYGLLYNWCAVMDTANPTYYVEVPTPSNDGNDTAFAFSFSDPHRGICPAGWHVPNTTEWNSLINSVGSQNAVKLADGDEWISYTGDYIGNRNHPNRNASGFTALPAGKFGYNDYGTASFGQKGERAWFWCSSQYGTAEIKTDAWNRYLYAGSKSVSNGYDNKGNGLSVRCIRNEGHAAVIFVTTSAASNIASTSATLNGSISNDSIIPITNRGFELKETVGGSYTPVTPDVDDPLSCNLTGLTPNTAYTFRAFATTSEGTIYGYERSFTTILPPPLFLTASPSVDTLNFCGGADTSITYTATFTNVSSSDYAISWKVNGTDSSAVTGLQLTVKIGASGKYKVACTATREGYPTLMDTIVTYVNVIGSLTDVDGNNYSVSQIGSQCWMTENLRTRHYSGGTLIPLNTGYPYTPSRYYPGGDTNNVSTYGYLYNWKAMIGENNTSSDDVPSGVQGVCPIGWHLPSAGEWGVLIAYVKSRTEYLCDGGENNIGKALASTSGWQPADNTCKVGNNPSDNNATGFNAVPAGHYRGYSTNTYQFYFYFTQWACFGSASLYDDYPYYIFLDYNRTNMLANYANWYYSSYDCAFSVRCVRDPD